MNPDDWEQCRRQEKGRLADPLKEDRLPPHAIESEQGVLGCCILSADCIARARKRLRDEEGYEFYDLRHREIWLTLVRMWDDRLAGKPLSSTSTSTDGIDVITIQQRLKDHQKLEAVGGLAYLTSLPDAVPSAANLDYYLEIVADKFARRRAIGACVRAVERFQGAGDAEHLLHTLQDELNVVSRLATPPQETARMYLRPVEMGDEFYQRWFGRTKGVHGYTLPELAFGNFPFLVRTRELTLFEAETKMGKSTMATYIAVHLLQQ